MSEKIETATVIEPIIEGPGGIFETRPSDCGIDLNNLPAAPWTPLKIGEIFYSLCIVAGAGDQRGRRNPSLDPRQFASGRLRRILQLKGLKIQPSTIQVIEKGQIVERTMTPEEVINWYEINYPGDEETRRAQFEEMERLTHEAFALQASIDAKLPAPEGTPRHPGAEPLRPGKTVRKTRTF